MKHRILAAVLVALALTLAGWTWDEDGASQRAEGSMIIAKASWAS